MDTNYIVMTSLLANIGIITIEKCLNFGQLARIGLEVTSKLCSTISDINKKYLTNESITKIIKESDLECTIRVVESILLEKQQQNILNNDGEEIMIIEQLEQLTIGKDDYVVIQDSESLSPPDKEIASKNNFFKQLKPIEVILFYMYDSILKISALLNNVKKKYYKHNTQFFVFKYWYTIDFVSECNELKILILQLKERIKLYGIVK
jgi:hypothetical protein